MTEPHGHCRHLAERISEYIDDELPSELRAEISTHLHDCADCENFVESLRRVKSLAHLLREPALTPERLRELSRPVQERLEGFEQDG